MAKKLLKKVTQDGQHYALRSFNDSSYVIKKYSNVTGDEAEFSKELAKFNNKEKVMEYWNKIK